MERHIVIIDDDPDDAEIFTSLISEEFSQFECFHFLSPQEALASLTVANERNTPKFIFVDFHMPAMTGEQCLEIIRGTASLSSAKVVMCTTKFPPNVRQRLYEKGADFVYDKPAELTELKMTLSSIIK